MADTSPLLVNPTPPSAPLHQAWANTADLMKAFGGNTGNMAFLNAALLTIDNLRPLRDRSFDEATSLVWACSNFLSEKRPIGGATKAAFGFAKPLVAIGLGAQAPDNDRIIDLPDNTLAWLQAVAKAATSDAPNIAVRGNYTKAVLDSVGLGDSTIVLGCPSLFLSADPALGAGIAQKLAVMDTPEIVGVCPGNLRNTTEDNVAVEQVLWNMMVEKSADYLIQHPPDVLALLLREPDIVTDYRIRLMAEGVAPGTSTDDFLRTLRRQATLFAEPTSWILSLRRLDMVTSARFHGTQFALQSGVPSLCITIDERHREMCDVMNIPNIDRTDVAGLTWPKALDLLRAHDWTAFDQRRQQLAAEYASFLTSNGLVPSAHLLGLLPK